MLKVKLLDIGPPKTVLRLALQPPDSDDIERTVLLLKQVRKTSRCDSLKISLIKIKKNISPCGTVMCMDLFRATIVSVYQNGISQVQSQMSVKGGHYYLQN